MKKKIPNLAIISCRKRIVFVLKAIRNVSLLVFVIDYASAQPCTLTCPTNVTVSNTPGQCGAIVNFPPSGTSGSCGPLMTTPASGTFFPVGTTIVTSQASASATSLYNQTGVSPGTGFISQNFQPASNNLDCNSADDFTVPVGQTWTITQVNVGGAYFSSPLGASSLNVTFYNNSGSLPSSVITTFNNVTTFNNSPNFNITLPSGVVLNAGTYWVSVQVNMDDPPNGLWAWSDFGNSAIASEHAWRNPGGGWGFSCGAPSYSAISTCIGGQPLNFIFEIIGTSSGGGSASCTFIVTVLDNQLPTITCPANITVNNTPGLCSAVVNYTVPVGTDNCPGVATALIAGLASGSLFPVGVTTNTFRATDASGNTATCSFTVTVMDNQLPTIICPANITANTDPNLCTASVATPNPTTADNCAVTQLTWALTGATTGNSPATGINNLGTAVFNKGVTTVTYIVKDAANNQATCFFTVTVVDNQLPAITCPANIIVNNTPGLCSAVVNYTTPVGTDNCPGVTTAQIAGLANGSTFPVGVTTNTFRATDAAGNISTCSFTVIVVDNQPPSVTCPASIVANTDISACVATVVTPNPTTSDNCAVTQVTWAMTGATVASSPATGINFVGTRAFNLNGATGQGITTITYTVKDAAGNTTTCSFTVTVNDAWIPVITTGGQPTNQTVCVGSNATFSVTASVPAGNPLTYQWQAWNGSAWVNIVGATASTLLLNAVTLSMNTNSYRCILTGRCSVVTSGFATLYVNPLPTISLTASLPPPILPTQTITLTATVNPPGGSFVWKFNGGTLTGITGSSVGPLTVDVAGIYRAIYTDPNGCVTTSADIVVSALASDNLYVYPNPNTGNFHVRFYNRINEPITINIFDSKGTKVYNKALATILPYTELDVDINHMPAGVYLVQVVNSTGKVVGVKGVIKNN